MNLKDKTAVVTGATGGIGSELVKKLDSEGVKLILVSKDQNELQTLVKNLQGENNKYYACDFNNRNETIKIAKQIASENPGIDILINSSGVGIYKPVEEASYEDWDTTFNVGLSSVFIFIKELVSNLSQGEDSLVLSIGSGAGVIPMSGRSVYCSSKFALRGLILSLAEEFKRIGNPRFCLITLGSTLTPFGPMSFDEKKEEMEKGKAYFTPKWVGDKLTEIIKDDNKETEYTLYPGDYGFGEWKKPEPK